MASTTLGIKVDIELRERLRRAADQLQCTPHWLHKQALLSYIEGIERGVLPSELTLLSGGDAELAEDGVVIPAIPFYGFAQDVQPQSVLRAAITAAYRRPETDCLPLLLSAARFSQSARAQELAARLVKALRTKRRGGGVEGLIQEFSLSSQEGVALMCLAEALLRIPDTRHTRCLDPRQDQSWRLASHTSARKARLALCQRRRLGLDADGPTGIQPEQRNWNVGLGLGPPDRQRR